MPGALTRYVRVHLLLLSGVRQADFIRDLRIAQFFVNLDFPADGSRKERCTVPDRRSLIEVAAAVIIGPGVSEYGSRHGLQPFLIAAFHGYKSLLAEQEADVFEFRTEVFFALHKLHAFAKQRGMAES